MEKKTISKYLTCLLALIAIVFALAGWYYTGGAQKVEGFFVGANKKAMGHTSDSGSAPTGSCSVGTCG